MGGKHFALTHLEWDILHPHLSAFSSQFVTTLLESEVPLELPKISEDTKRRFHYDVAKLICRIMDVNFRPHRLLNKLVSLLSDADHSVYSKIITHATLFYERIMEQVEEEHKYITMGMDLEKLKNEAYSCVEDLSSYMKCNQTSVNGVPWWFRKNERIDPVIVLQFLVHDSLSKRSEVSSLFQSPTANSLIQISDKLLAKHIFYQSTLFNCF